MNPLNSLSFDNTFTRLLPADREPENYLRQVTGACYSHVMPTKVVAPKLIAHSPDVSVNLGLPEDAHLNPEFLDVFSGNKVLEAMSPHAMCYGGHQFGNWAGQLGDGRAINLGEVINPEGKRLTLQLKGAGPTPYSRSADGLAVLRSSVREFICSEAMYHLGVPTTRALSVATTGEMVVRDMFYDGHPQAEPGAVVCRVAPSFLRFGNFEILAARGEIELLRQLVDYTIDTHFQDIESGTAAAYNLWFQRVCNASADMVVQWMRVGFVHGVMNTDNMSIHGLTIDYGPYGWLDNYDPDWTPNTTDAAQRRYRFGQQPQIAQWNLLQLANAIYPLTEESAPLESALSDFMRRYQKSYYTMMAEKLGIPAKSAESVMSLNDDLLKLLQRVETDMTIFYRRLPEIITAAGGDLPRGSALEPLMDAYYVKDQLTEDYLTHLSDWLTRYLDEIAKTDHSPTTLRTAMNSVNPKFVPRNYLAQLAIDDAEQGDPTRVRELYDVLRHPYAEQPGRELYAAIRPDWARTRPGCSMLSCSS